MALTVNITGDLNINQGEQTTLTATVTDSGGNTPVGTLTYLWTASHGQFIGATNQATAVWEANFTDPNDVDTTITCSVGRAADASPTVATGSLTAMNELGITGQILNMYITETEDSANGSNKVIYASGSSDSVLDAGSDDDITNAINTWRVQYHEGNDWFILNNDGSGDLDGFFRNNTTQSVYLVFSDGDHFEITNARYNDGAAAWCRWDVTAVTGLATKLDDIAADDTLLVGVGDAGSIGIEADSGTGTAQVTAEAAAEPGVLHVWDNSDANIRVIPIDIADGVTGSAIRTYTVTGLTDVQSLVFDGTHLHATRWNDETVHVFLPSTADGQAATVVRTYEVSGIRQPGAMAFDGTNIHIGDREDNNFRVIPPDTANGETATLIREYTVPGVGDMRGMTFDGTDVHIGDYSDDNFRVIAVPTTGGAQTVLRTYTVAGVSVNRAMAFDGTDVHISDVSDDNFRVIALPTADGAQTILRTYTVTGIGEPRGMELVPNTTPTFPQASYSFTNVAIAVNTVVATVAATDADNDPLTYSLTGADAGSFAIASDGEITVSTELAENSTYSFDVTVNDGTVDVTVSVTVASVTTGPPTDATFTITGPTDDIYAGQTVDFTIESDIDITDFTFDDIVLTGATFVSFTLTSENTWRYRVTADAGAGSIALIIREDSVMPGNNAASATFTRRANPTVAITTTDSDIRVDHIFTVGLDWSSNVTGFANADVTVTGATKLNFTGSGRNYVLALRSSTTPGDIVVTVRENAVVQRNAETSETFVNNDLATVTMTPRQTSIRGGRSTVVDVTFTENVTNLNLSDFSVDVGTVSNLTGSGDTYEVTVTAPTTGTGDLTLTLREEVTQPENHEATATIAYEPLPTVAITSSNANIQPDDDFTVTFQWDEAVTGFATGDVTVTGATKGAFTAVDADTYTLALTAASMPGDIVVTVGTDAITELNAETSETFTNGAAPDQVVTAQPIDFQMRSVSAKLEIQGEDVTEYLIPNQPLLYYESLDYPDFGVFEARGIQLLLDNRSAKFSTGGAPNFWTDNSLPSSGAGAEVLLTITETQGTDSRDFRFAGRLEMVRQELKRKVVTLVLRDLSLLLRFGIPSDFGQEITRTITDFDGAVENYMPGQFRFDFPEGYFPIAEGSLSVVRIDGTDRHDVTVVDEMTTSGMLTDDQVFVSYAGGYIQFETEPANGEVTELECTWKLSYHYRRPDALFMELIKGAGVHDVLGITDDAQLRYAMEESGIRVTSPTFTSRGRPYLDVNGITRWLLHDSSDDKWYLAHEDRLVEYDTVLDTYMELAQLPSSDAGFTPPNYGSYLASESWDTPTSPLLNNIDGLEVVGNLIYINGAIAGSTAEWHAFSLLGDRQPADDIELGGVGTIAALGYYDGVFYYASNSGRDIWAWQMGDTGAGTMIFQHTTATNQPAVGIAVIDTRIYLLVTPTNTSQVSSVKVYSVTNLGPTPNTFATQAERNAYGTANPDWLAEYTANQSLFVTVTGDIGGGNFNRVNNLWVAVDSHVQIGTFQPNVPPVGLETQRGVRTFGITYVDGEVFFGDDQEGRVVAISVDEAGLSANFNESRDIIAGRTFAIHSTQLDASDDANIEGLDFHNQRLYVVTDDPSPRRMNVYYLGIGAAQEAVNYRPLQIATHDHEDFYALATITADGDQFDKAVFNPVRIYKYDKSADTLDIALDESDGEPQLAHPYHLNGEDTYRADNRKNFQVVSRSNKTLIFFRYSESDESGIAYRNDTDDTLTKVYTLAHTTGDGIPYSMDFALDERNDGIYVYTFVVWTDDTNDESILRLYRERVEPSAAESQQYTETIDYAENADTDNEIAVSVSDVILDDTNDKWFFVLTYTTDGDSSGKAELCTIAKDGGGSRTVLKTYDNPLVSARSPVIIGTTIYYLEGGSIRNPRASTEPEGTPIGINAYPDEGGTLVSINGATNAITELGLVRRDGTQADSPDDEDDRYAGWGRFNSVLSNIEVDDNDNIHFVTGYGLPVHAEQNSAASSLENPVFLLSNYQWLQYGNDLATKVKALAGSGQSYWNVAQQLSTLVGWELGLGPHSDVVSAYQTAYSSASDWSANALPFFRKTGVIESTISANIGTGTITSISLNNSTRFPIPPTNASYRVQIGSEVFIYTGRTSTQLTGISRAQDGAVASAHTSGDEIHFVHGVIRDTDNSLVDITEKYPDIVNLYNVVRLAYDNGVRESENMTSIDEHGRLVLSLTASLLTMMDTEWQDYLIGLYLDRYATSRTLLEVQVPLNFDIDLGNVVTVKTDGGVVLDYALYRVLRRTHDFRQYQTSLLLREL